MLLLRHGSKVPIKTAVRGISVMERHENDVLTLESIKKANERIKPYIHRTPVLTSTFADDIARRKLFFKSEVFQKAGSFKIRGVTNSILRIKEERNGEPFHIVTHSSGNHGQAVAKAASTHGVKCTIICPSIAPTVKKNAIVGYGASLLECEPSPIARQELTDQTLKELGDEGEFVPSADHPFMMEGSGSVAVEMLEENPDLDAFIVCCGTGGLTAGIAKYCKEIDKNMLIYAAEPELADDCALSLKQGKRIVYTHYPDTIADGLRMSIGKYTWPVIQENVDGVITVDDNDIVRSMYFLWERMKILVEPSGAVSFAAALSNQFKELPNDVQKVGITLSGGNIDLMQISWMLNPEKFDLKFPQ